MRKYFHSKANISVVYCGFHWRTTKYQNLAKIIQCCQQLDFQSRSVKDINKVKITRKRLTKSRIFYKQ